MGLATQFILQFGDDQNLSGYISNMLDMCNYFFSNFFLFFFYKLMSVAKVKVAQNRNVCDHSEKKLQDMFFTYPIQFELS